MKRHLLLITVCNMSFPASQMSLRPIDDKDEREHREIAIQVLREVNEKAIERNGDPTYYPENWEAYSAEIVHDATGVPQLQDYRDLDSHDWAEITNVKGGEDE